MEDLIAYVVREHERIGDAGLGTEFGNIREYAVEPNKKQENMLVVANGSSFNPNGEGRGIYIWAGNTWNLLRLLPARVITDPVPQEDTSPESTTPTPPFVPPQPPAEELPVLLSLAPATISVDPNVASELVATIDKTWADPVTIALAVDVPTRVSIATQATIAVGQTTVTIPFTGLTTGDATVTAAFNGVGKTTVVTVRPNPEEPPPDPNDPPEEGDPNWELPADVALAVPTIHCMGLYWQPPSVPPDGVAYVEYKKQTDVTWKKGFPLWYDPNRNLCIGSIVYLTKDTGYDFRLGIVDGVWTAGAKMNTWPEVADLPLGTVEQVGNRTNPLNAQAGTSTAWRVYENGTIDVGMNFAMCVNVSVPYVIFRNIVFKGATSSIFELFNGCHHLVISHCEFTAWGSENVSLTNKLIPGNGSYGGQTMGYRIARSGDSVIHAFGKDNIDAVIFEHNKIHDKNFGANPWDIGHPTSDAVIYIDQTTAKQWIIRYNEVYNATSHETPSNQTPLNYTKYIGDFFVGDNWGNTRPGVETGSPPNDSDMYGNFIQGIMDDGVECEGSQVNTRVWNNYFDNMAVGVAGTQCLRGPVYVWRNVFGRARHLYKSRVQTGVGTEGADVDARLQLGKFASQTQDNISRGGGRRFFFHNTVLQPPPSGRVGESQFPLGLGYGVTGLGGEPFRPMQNLYSRNNILYFWKDTQGCYGASGGTNNNVDYDLHNGPIDLPSPNVVGANMKRTISVSTGTPPAYKDGHGGLVSRTNGIGRFQLASGDGLDDGQQINNFNTDFEGGTFYGTGPDRGAHESGSGDMIFGVTGSGNGAPI